MKPDVTFFGEKLPEHFFDNIREARTPTTLRARARQRPVDPARRAQDVKTADLCVVIGSSLKVSPVCTIPSQLPDDVPQIIINCEIAGRPNRFDVELLVSERAGPRGAARLGRRSTGNSRLTRAPPCIGLLRCGGAVPVP
jgi:NAD-dependent SIR2 family protein deacetylase